jgi:hypothetical protein
MIGGGMIKQIVAILLVVLSAGAWFYLDYMNKQELMASGQMRLALAQMRQTEEENRARAKAKFEAAARNEFIDCLGEAERARSKYINTNISPIPKKPDLLFITRPVLEEATKILAASTVACQLAYDSRLKKGA